MTADLFRKTILPSGLTLLTERMPDRRSLALGVWVRSGARDEPGEMLGISHFIEHMMFKGTERRDARAIAASLESLGGHLDAFTAREEVCYYARALAEHLPEATEILADIVCRSRFAPEEVDREKSVVREEIFSCEDNPEEKINDMVAEQVWPGHPLGRPILGTVDTVDQLDSPRLRQYFRSRYRPDHLVVAAVGAVEHERLEDVVAQQFEPPDGPRQPLSGPPPGFAPGVRHVMREDLHQLYLALGTRGLGYADPERYVLVVLNTLLGGGMSSRLFQSVREEAGLAYSVFSAVEFYRETGLLSIQLGVAPERGREALQRVRLELEALAAEGPTEEEVAAARHQLKGSLVMGQESVSNRLYHLAHEEIYRGGYTSPDEQLEKILAVGRDQVADMSRRLLSAERFALSALGPPTDEPLDGDDWPVGSPAAMSRT
ncbi:MAG TPA: pitrilysin family protein [Terriglobales bacterium]|nr:pitrilysin family protein [Terriglobales bacterium]